MLGKMKELMEMKSQADKIKRELDSTYVDVAERGVKMRINGSQQVHSIEIAEELAASGNKSRIENEVLKCLNAAMKQSQKIAAEKMRNMMPGFPG